MSDETVSRADFDALRRDVNKLADALASLSETVSSLAKLSTTESEQTRNANGRTSGRALALSLMIGLLARIVTREQYEEFRDDVRKLIEESRDDLRDGPEYDPFLHGMDDFLASIP